MRKIKTLMCCIALAHASQGQLKQVGTSEVENGKAVYKPQAQNAGEHYCYSQQQLDRDMAANPNMRAVLEVLEQRSQQNEEGQYASKAAVITIPVVFHVLYKNVYENISDQQIQSQLDELNADYNGGNWDSIYIPSPFKSKYANMGIKFCLANRDPNGNPTKGIIRKSTTKTSWVTGDTAIKYSSLGGDNGWNRDKYLNIWIVNSLSGNTLAYATFPGGSFAQDGIVTWYECVGTRGTLSYPYTLGKVLTHEVGHWLNLRHIWGDDNGACTGSDNVGDTPNAGNANYGNPVFPHITCSNGPNGDMYVNHMDYVDDQSKAMFTKGQKTRAVAALNGPRVSIQTSNGCVAPNTTALTVPTGMNIYGVNDNSASIAWNTVSGAAWFEVQYKNIGGTTWTTKTSTTIIYRIQGLLSNTSYNYRVRAVYANGMSAYTNTGTFTTANTTACAGDPFEPNDEFVNHCPINEGKNYYAKLSATDLTDWYMLKTNVAMPYVRVTLSNLQADYDLQVNLLSGTFVASSSNAGTANEVINLSGAAGDWILVNVNGYFGTTNACYKLRVDYSAVPFALNSDDRVGSDIDSDIIKMNVMPNPAVDNTTIKILSNENMEARILITNVLGEAVYTTQTLLVEGENTMELPIAKWENGLYNVIVTTRHTKQSERLVVQR